MSLFVFGQIEHIVPREDFSLLTTRTIKGSLIHFVGPLELQNGRKEVPTFNQKTVWNGLIDEAFVHHCKVVANPKHLHGNVVDLLVVQRLTKLRAYCSLLQHNFLGVLLSTYVSFFD
jgi:hypothetical protein